MVNFIKNPIIASAVAIIFVFTAAGTVFAVDETPRFFNIVEKKAAGKLFDEALESLKKGEKEDALKKFESALVSDQSLLLKDDSGLCKMLIQKYEKDAVNVCDVAVYYKLAHLYDLTGEIEKAVENYKLALKTSFEKEVLDDISQKLEGLNREIEFSKAENKPAVEPVEPEPKAPSVKPAVVKKQDDSIKNCETLIAEYKQKIKDVDEKLAAKADELSTLKNSERMAKNDWSKRTDFQRDWRDAPNEGASDPEDPYQNTYRRRYRQAKKSRESVDAEIEELKNRKAELEKSLDLMEPPSGENVSEQ